MKVCRALFWMPDVVLCQCHMIQLEVNDSTSYRTSGNDNREGLMERQIRSVKHPRCNSYSILLYRLRLTMKQKFQNRADQGPSWSKMKMNGDKQLSFVGAAPSRPTGFPGTRIIPLTWRQKIITGPPCWVFRSIGTYLRFRRSAVGRIYSLYNVVLPRIESSRNSS
ncbi:hypothetical protein EV360DRAFT_73844 [Lentinula raphanica]|nr:hypothetical protein EV360DRAFT_73844 [Lentinula raphanica]